MKPALRAKLQALGVGLAPSMLQGTTALMAAIAAPPDPAVRITRDHQYGPDPRNRLDVFARGGVARATVLVFVHGGGFVMGDKTTPGSPFYDNFGLWAARQDCIGVTLTYRLAPTHRWPCGPADIAAAMAWLRANIGAHGGDPQSIILMGQSAGGAHVAAYVALPRFHADGSPGIAGAVMMSGIYDAVSHPASQFSNAYYGEGAELRAEARCIDGLVESRLPLLFTVSELDPPDFHDQAARLARAWHERRASCPPLEYLAGHNHLTPAQSLGSTEEQMAQRLSDFIAVVTRA